MVDMNNEDRLIFVNIKHSYEAMIKNETSAYSGAYPFTFWQHIKA